MDGADLYSDRAGVGRLRVLETLPLATSTALIALVGAKLEANWFASAFPEQCRDGNGIAGTDLRSVGATLKGVIPGLEWPLWKNERAPDGQVFDLIEYSWSVIALPSNLRWHDYMRHFELSFDRDAGRQQLLAEVNLVLARGGTVFQMATSGRIERHGMPELVAALNSLRPATGDATLDDLIEQARKGYLSRHPGDRATAIERLWDAFERLKTLDIPGDGNKKQSVTALLAKIPDTAVRSVVESEMTTLTNVGNEFMVRHFETGKHPVPAEASDYIAGRILNLLMFLLQASGRLAPRA